MNLDEALRLFPECSPYREVLTSFMAEDRNRRWAASQAMWTHGLIAPHWEEAKPKDEQTAFAVLRCAVELAFPAPASTFENVPAELILSIVGSVYPSMVDYVRAGFGRLDERLRLDLLMLVASAGTRAGASTFVELVEEYGWPQRMHARFFSELGKNLAHADVMFPALLEKPGFPRIEMGDLLLRALRSGAVEPTSVANAGPMRGLDAAIDALLEEHDEHDSQELAMLLDLAGFGGGPDIRATLQRATGLSQTWPAAFAVTSLLRRGEAVQDSVITRVASDHAVRNTFYSMLAPLRMSQRIPPHLRSRDAFAAADMVEWLSHAGELGRTPDDLEQMKVIETTRDAEKRVLYVWRFRIRQEPWLASVSGLYPAEPPEGPLHGNETFSRFEEWDRASADDHARAVLKNLGAWSAPDNAARD